MNSVPAVVLGSGPAAWSLAAALCRRGIDTVLVAPDPHACWPQTYGMWTYQWPLDLAEVSGVEDPFATRWDSVAVIGDRAHTVGRAYGLLDNERVRLGFSRAAEASGRLDVRAGVAVAVEQVGDRYRVRLDGGAVVAAQVVFDGTGARSTFVRRESVSPPSVLQTAFGLTVRARTTPFADDVCVLMDWRGPSRRDATFLYALPFGKDRWLFEETSLARREGLGRAELETRLRNRLNELGVEIDIEEGEEWVSFPMDVALPVRSGGVVPIGAAAALGHPATGYSVAASFRTAAALARAVADADTRSGEAIIDACWNVLWSPERRKARRLESYGLERLLTMDQADTRLFFDTFFTLAPKQTAIYLGGDADAVALSGVMWAMFRRSPLRLQRRLATGNPLMLAQSLLG